MQALFPEMSRGPTIYARLRRLAIFKSTHSVIAKMTGGADN